MNHKFAAKSMRYLADKAVKDGDGYMGMYFDRKNKKFAGVNVGMNENDALQVIDQIMAIFKLDAAAVAEHLKPTPAIILPIGGKFPTQPDGAA
jgi:hypothetical protein